MERALYLAVFFFAGLVAAWGLITGILVATSAKVRCLFRTRHENKEALGSIMREDGPRFIYVCRDCGAYWTEPWE